MKLKQNKISIIFALILGVFVLFGGYSSYSFSSVCGKCLQHASVHEEKIYGLTFVKWNSLKKNPDKLLRSTKTEPKLPHVSPDLYREIFDEECRHDFIKGGFGAIKGFALHIDGSSPQMKWYRLRLEMIEALYAAYVNTGSKDLARKTYELIDREFPIDDEIIYEANNILKLQERISIDDLSHHYPEAAQIARTMLEFQEIIPSLRQVKTQEQWRELLSDLNSIGVEDELVEP